MEKTYRYGKKLVAILLSAGLILSGCASGTSQSSASTAESDSSAQSQSDTAQETTFDDSVISKYAQPVTDCSHVDADKDCKCDLCGNQLDHTDEDGDEVCDYCGEGAPLYSFIACSDTHIAYETSFIRFSRFLKIAFHGDYNIAPVDTILVGGDVVDEPTEEYWYYYNTLVNAIAPDANIYTIPGNHDGDGVELYVKNTDYGGVGYENSVYKATGDEDLIQCVSVDIGTEDHKYRVIGLGNGSSTYWDDNTKALNWLDEQIQDAIEKNGASAPIFVMSHGGVQNTAAGTYTKWLRNTQDGGLNTILEKYPNVIFFSGHTHESLEAAGNNYSNGGAHHFGTASIWYLSEFMGGNSRTYMDGDNSEAYLVQVYSDRVVLQGYNFSSEKWILESENYGYATPDDPREDVDKFYGYIGDQTPVCRIDMQDSVYTVMMPEE